MFASRGFERRELKAWIDGARPSGADQPEAVHAGKPRRLAAALDASLGDPAVVPLGIARLPEESSGAPWPALLRRLRRSGWGASRIIVGEPARVSELRQRWLRNGWTEAGDQGFANFVRRQGVLALERAERELVGS